MNSFDRTGCNPQLGYLSIVAHTLHLYESGRYGCDPVEEVAGSARPTGLTLAMTPSILYSD